MKKQQQPTITVEIEESKTTCSTTDTGPARRRERRKTIFTAIGLFLFFTGIAAGIHVAERWFSADSGTNLDVFLFVYALLATPIGFTIMAGVNFCENDDEGPDTTWYYDSLMG